VEPNQIRVVAAAVSCGSQQIIHALEPGFTGEIVADIRDLNRLNRIHDDMPIVHPVTATHLHMGTRPDANAASDSAAPDSLAEVFDEHHSGVFLSAGTFTAGSKCTEVQNRPTSVGDRDRPNLEDGRSADLGAALRNDERAGKQEEVAAPRNDLWRRRRYGARLIGDSHSVVPRRRTQQSSNPSATSSQYFLAGILPGERRP
jgi:hypothetical protein